MFLNLLHLVVSIRNVSTIAMYCNSIVLFKPTIVIAIVLFNNSNTTIHCNTFHSIAMDNTLFPIPGIAHSEYIGLEERDSESFVSAVRE